MQVEEIHSERSLKRTIAASMDTLSKGERKVARALLASYPAAGLATVASLATDAGVSPPTVLRFATRLGYTGFPEFQKALVHEINEGMGSPLKQYEASPSEGDILDRSKDVFHSSIDASFTELSRWEFERLVRFLADESREVRVVGGRFSRLLADYLASHLQLIRPRIQLIPRDELPRLAAVTDAGPSTLLIAYDYRRYDEVTAQFVGAMRAKGATIALMTDNWLSPIAKSADIVVTCRVEAPSPFDSLVPATALTEALIAAVTDGLGERGRTRLEAVEASAESQESVL
ncbi:MurR/RpiR family transcriptional regulator [Paenarthrobacter sp. NPDC090517]|uniref:MurR/RpiR family transcriptional regulator n=1 Tax=Paenarthrobacter sp. NPDC090517 TaxID=3364381 RepID=UPI0037F39385